MSKANEALDKKAENARELGLDYEPVQDSGIVTAGGFGPRTQRPWLDLTDEQIKAIEAMALTKNMAIVMTMAALKEVNT